MKKLIYAAKEGDKSEYEVIMDAMDSDFDYLIAGLEKLQRDGFEDKATEIAKDVQISLAVAITDISDVIAEN